MYFIFPIYDQVEKEATAGPNLLGLTQATAFVVGKVSPSMAIIYMCMYIVFKHI